MHLSGHLSAMQLCITAHWAAESGLRGPAKDLARAPGRQVGSYQGYVDKVLDLGGRTGLYAMEVPGHSRHDLGRATRAL
eukprot:8154844-Alexandrium_andersonii.AAC.1